MLYYFFLANEGIHIQVASYSMLTSMRKMFCLSTSQSLIKEHFKVFFSLRKNMQDKHNCLFPQHNNVEYVFVLVLFMKNKRDKRFLFISDSTTSQLLKKY